MMSKQGASKDELQRFITTWFTNETLSEPDKSQPYLKDIISA